MGYYICSIAYLWRVCGIRAGIYLLQTTQLCTQDCRRLRVLRSFSASVAHVASEHIRKIAILTLLINKKNNERKPIDSFNWRYVYWIVC